MAVNVNLNTDLTLYKLAKQGGTDKSGGGSKPSLFNSNDPVLSKNGSIFNTPSSAGAKVNKQFANLSKDPFAESKSPKGDKPSQFGDINENNAKTKISDAKNFANTLTTQVGNLKGETTTVENNTRISEEMVNIANKNVKTIQEDVTKFEKTMKLEEAAFVKTQNELTLALGAQDSINQEIDAIQTQLQALDGMPSFDEDGFNNSVYSLTLAGDKEGAQKNAANQAGGNPEREALLAQLDGLIGKSETYGNKIYTLSCKSSRYVQRMETMGKAYNNAQIQMQNNIQTQQQQNSEFLNVALEAEAISTMVTSAGQTAEGIGAALIAAGGATSWTGFGNALTVVGQFLQKTGMVAKTVGQYGTCAANVAKTAAYAADGNWMAAIQSAGSAIAAGAAAAKSTKNFKAEWKNVDVKADASRAQSEARKLARDQVKNNGATEGLSKSESRKAIREQLLADENTKLVDGKNYSEIMAQMNEIKEFPELDRITKGLSTGFNSAGAMMGQFGGMNGMGMYGMNGMNMYGTNPMGRGRGRGNGMPNIYMSDSAMNMINKYNQRQMALASRGF